MAYSINDACCGCEACTILCPVAAIYPIPEHCHVHSEKHCEECVKSEHCLAKAPDGTLRPRKAINPKRCVECGVCGFVCGRDAVVDAAGNPLTHRPRKDWPKPVITPEKCSACGICVQVCTSRALAISLPKFKGDLRVAAYLANEKKCVGCSLCAKDCPMDAITMRDPSREAPSSAAAPKEVAK